MDLSPKEQAQLQAEVAMTGFIAWSKRVFLYFAIFLCIVVFACNSGVETGPGKTGSQYDGSVYSPDNIKVEK